MGWVEDRFQERAIYRLKLGDLWNDLRDSVGTAVQEFNARLFGIITGSAVKLQNCSARGQYCLRLQKSDSLGGAIIEIFLEDEALKTSLVNGHPDRVCCFYRVNTDRSGVEFFRNTETGPVVISAEEACQMALDEFLFKPFPPTFNDQGQIVNV